MSDQWELIVPMEIFVQRVKERSERLGFSQAEVARRCGVTERAFNHYMSGRSEPNLATLLRIAAVLDCTPNELLGVSRLTVSIDEKSLLRGQIAALSQVRDEPALRLATAIGGTAHVGMPFDIVGGHRECLVMY